MDKEFKEKQKELLRNNLLVFNKIWIKDSFLVRQINLKKELSLRNMFSNLRKDKEFYVSSERVEECLEVINNVIYYLMKELWKLIN